MKSKLLWLIVGAAPSKDQSNNVRFSYPFHSPEADW